MAYTTLAFTTNDQPIRTSLGTLIHGPVSSYPIKFIITVNNKDALRIHYTEHDDQ